MPGREKLSDFVGWTQKHIPAMKRARRKSCGTTDQTSRSPLRGDGSSNSVEVPVHWAQRRFIPGYLSRFRLPPLIDFRVTVSEAQVGAAVVPIGRTILPDPIIHLDSEISILQRQRALVQKYQS